VDVTLTQDGVTQKLTMFSNGGKTDYPIFTAGADQICQGLRFYDGNGVLQTGTKLCSETNDAVKLPPCTANGEVDCRANAAFKAADTTQLMPDNIKSGVTIAGVAGTVAPSPANCSSNGTQRCVATGAYYAATECAADSSNCFVPSYVASSKPLKAINYDVINSGKTSIRTSLTLSGITGTLVDCSANAIAGCVTTTTYRSGNLANLSAGNIKKNVTIAGVVGNYPSVTTPLATDSGLTDLTTVGPTTTLGAYQFFDKTGGVHTLTVSNA
jgi:hypothetical protein